MVLKTAIPPSAYADFQAQVENIPLSKFNELTGITPKAVYHRIARGEWLECYEFHRSKTGLITVHIPGYNRWAQGKPRVKA